MSIFSHTIQVIIQTTAFYHHWRPCHCDPVYSTTHLLLYIWWPMSIGLLLSTKTLLCSLLFMVSLRPYFSLSWKLANNLFVLILMMLLYGNVSSIHGAVCPVLSIHWRTSARPADMWVCKQTAEVKYSNINTDYWSWQYLWIFKGRTGGVFVLATWSQSAIG